MAANTIGSALTATAILQHPSRTSGKNQLVSEHNQSAQISDPTAASVRLSVGTKPSTTMIPVPIINSILLANIRLHFPQT